MRTLTTTGAFFAVDCDPGIEFGFSRRPHMDRAVEHLRAACAELQEAVRDKGGWRARALEHVNHAIAETEHGSSFCR